MSEAEPALSPGHTSPIPNQKSSLSQEENQHQIHQSINPKIENSPGTESTKDSGKCSASDTSNNATDR